MKNALVTGCSGLVGTHLVNKLIQEGYQVFGVDLKDNRFLPESGHFTYIQKDLSQNNAVIDVLDIIKPDVVFNCFGIKGSPLRASESPVDFLLPSFKINTEIINQCCHRDIWLIFVSSVGVYAPSEKFVESSVWETLPSKADWFPSWSKRMGEMLLEAHMVQYGYKKWSIVRPANIFGEYDDFSGNGTVISSTIKKIYEADNEIESWGDGSPVRDFVYAGDVADALIKMYDFGINDVVNFGSGEEITIKSMIENLIEISGKDITIKWDPTKPLGDLRRQMDTTKQKQINLLPQTGFKEGLRKTYNFYINHGPKTHEFQKEESKSNLISLGYHSGDTSEINIDKEKVHEYYKYLIDNHCEDKSKYIYRYQIQYNNGDYPHSLSTKEEIIERDKFVTENNVHVIQKWWEMYTFDTPKLVEIRNYFRGVIESFIFDLYPNISPRTICHHDNITLYESGDFIEPHRDGYNNARSCVVLIYLNDEEDYKNQGGKIILLENGVYREVDPINKNYVILDFSKNNPQHEVQPVSGDFKRFTYINFIHDNRLCDHPVHIKNII